MDHEPCHLQALRCQRIEVQEWISSSFHEQQPATTTISCLTGNAPALIATLGVDGHCTANAPINRVIGTSTGVFRQLNCHPLSHCAMSEFECRSGLGSKSGSAPNLKLQEWTDSPFEWPMICGQIRLKSLETTSHNKGHLEGDGTQQRSQPTIPSDYRLITEAFEESETDCEPPTTNFNVDHCCFHQSLHPLTTQE